MGDFAKIEIQFIGSNNTSTVFSGGNKTVSAGSNAYTLVETAPNTGVFESKIGVQDLANALGYPIKVGDKVRITYFDNMESPMHVSSALMNIK